MARKKYVEDQNDDGNHIPKGQNLGGSIQMHQGQGGGTKTRKSQDQKFNDDSFVEVKKQLANIGLTIREMPGDGNCLFRALSDQLCGNARNHFDYRRAVVQYMREFRPDFEPFVEDDVPFDKYLQNLAQPGTFAGNDAIVAFSRLHNVTVCIHQLNSPAWLIHPSKEQDNAGGREIHIAYHNGDHYNSVRRIGDDSENPTNIKLLAQGASKEKASKNLPPSPAKGRSETRSSNCAATSVFESYDNCVAYGGRDEDYWVKDNADIDRLVEDVMSQTDSMDPLFIRETLLEFNFDMAATVDFILSMSVVMSQQDKNDEVTEPGSSSTDCHSIGHRDQSSVSSGVRLSEKYAPKKHVTDMDEQCEDLGESEGSSKADDSDESPTSPISEKESSQNKPSSSRKETRLNGRRKKELKKRERKREADLRKKRTSSNDNEQSKENTIVVSNFGSLDI